jgi:hypothetical protein
MRETHRKKSEIIEVRCSQTTHKIILTQSGALSFPDHSKGFLVEKVLEQITGKTCRCHAILKAWRNNLPNNLPTKLQELRKKAREISCKRKSQRGYYSEDLDVPLLARINNRIHSALYSTRRELKYIWHIKFMLTPKSKMPQKPIRYNTIKGIYVYINYGWYKNVYLRGLAVLDGLFVLSAGPSDEKTGNIPVTVITEVAHKGAKILAPAQGVAIPIVAEQDATKCNQREKQYKVILPSKDDLRNNFNKKCIVKVRCSNKMHNITLTPSGALAFLDHPKNFTSIAPKSYSDPRYPIKCYSVLRNWRYKNFRKLPEELKRARIISAKIKDERRMKREETPRDPLSVPLLDRGEKRIVAIVEDLLFKIFGEKRICYYVRSRCYSKPSFLTRFRLYGEVTIGRDWYKNVYKRGIAIAGNVFVLSVKEPLPCGSIPANIVCASNDNNFPKNKFGYLVRQSEQEEYSFLDSIPETENRT